MVVATPFGDAGPGTAGGGTASQAWACALRQIAELLGRDTEDQRVRAALAAEPALSDLGAIAGAAARLGLRARIRRTSPRRLRRAAPPFLVVGEEIDDVRLVRERKAGRPVAVDPATGRSLVTTHRSLAASARHLVEFAPAATAGPPSTRGSGLDAVLLDRRFWPAFIQIAAASALVNLIALATPVFMMAIYNKVLRHAALSTLDVLAVGMLGFAAFELVLRALRGQLVTFTGARLDAGIGREVTHRLLHLPYASFAAVPPATMLERLRQLDHLRAFFTGHLPVLLVDLLFVGLFLVALFLLAPPLGWVALFAVPLFALLGWIARRGHRRWALVASRAQAVKGSHLLESLGNALTVKALALEPEMEARITRRLDEGAWTGHKASLAGHLASSGALAVQHLVAIAIVYAGARMVIDGTLSIGGLVASTILAARALAPVRQLFLSWPQLQQAREAAVRIDSLLRQPPEESDGGAGRLVEPKGHLRLEGVTFHYAPDAPPALDQVNLDIRPGTMLAVAGPPGSGKSTLVRLIAGVLAPTSGRILVDDLDLRRLDQAGYRRRIGVVPQELQLFEGTIAENIALGAGDCSPERIVAAARFVGLHDIVQRLPRGYETRLGEHGAGLSRGQKQLVCIARAVIRNPRLLVLDEVTSALDPATEAHLLINLLRAGSGRTILLVSHRPSAIVRCSRAILLQHGRVVRDGLPGEIVRVLAGDSQTRHGLGLVR